MIITSSNKEMRETKTHVMAGNKFSITTGIA